MKNKERRRELERIRYDHVIPLQGQFVSGLHMPLNLQVIPGVENVKKSNRYLPA